MYSKIILIFLHFATIQAKISININANESETKIEYSGIDVKVIDDSDRELFKLTAANLNEAAIKHYGRRPQNIYLKSPTPWGDLYKKYNWEQITRVLQVKSARIKTNTKKPIILIEHDFFNHFNNTIKVNTGFSQTVENVLTTTWSKNTEVTVTQEIEYELNVIFMKLDGNTGFSYSTSIGISEEKSQSVTVGSSSGVETELQPGQHVTAKLTANRGVLEVEIVYEASLRGNVAVNFKKSYNGHHFWGPPIGNLVKENGSIKKSVTFTENVQLGFYTDASLVVYDKKTGLPL